MIEAGQTVKVVPAPGSIYEKAAWFPKTGEVTATVLQVFKNGVVKIQWKRLNSSTQGRKGHHVIPGTAELIAI